MCKTLKPNPIVLAAALLCTTAGTAFAEHPAVLKEMTFTTQSVYNQVIHVVSSDNIKWDKIQSGSVSFGAHINIKLKWAAGRIKFLGVLHGACGGSACGGKPVLWHARPETRNYEAQLNVTLPTSKIPVSTTGIATVPLGDQIIARCNEKVTMNGGEAHSFDQWVPVTFAADTIRGEVDTSGLDDGSLPDQWTHYANDSRTSSFNVKVQCEPFEREKAEDVPDDPDYAVSGVKLFLSTFSDAKTNPAPGVQCEKGRILARLTTTKEGPVKFRLYTQVGDGPIEQEFVEAWSSKKGSEFKAEHKKWVSVTKSTNLKAMVQDLTNPIGNTSGWKDLPLHCSAPGGGGWAQPPKPNVGDGAAPKAESPPKPPKVIVTPRPQAKPPIIVTPKPRRPKKPAIKVAPKPRLVCINGRVSRNACFCPARTVKKRIGTTAYRCDRVVAKPKRVVPKAPPKRVRPKAPPKRIITRSPPKRSTPTRATPKRSTAKKIAPASRTKRRRGR